MRFPMDTYKGEGASLGKLFQLNVITSLTQVFFFKWRFPFSHMLPIFQDSFIFEEATSSYFFRATTSTQQLLFWSSYFFRAAVVVEVLLFQKSHFFTVVIFFSEQLLFQCETSTEQPLLENRTFFRKIHFRNSYPFGGRIVQNKNVYREANFSKQVLLQNIIFCRRAKFWKNLIFSKALFRIIYFSWRAIFLERLLFEITLLSTAATFSEDSIFTKDFQKRYYVTATFFSQLTLPIYQLVIKWAQYQLHTLKV